MARISTTSTSTLPESQILSLCHPWREAIFQMICRYSEMSRQVSYNCRERGLSSLFFFDSDWLGFALDVFFLFFFDLLTPREYKELIESSLIGVSSWCQIGVIWFWLTPRPKKSVRCVKVLTPLIINALRCFGVKRCQIEKIGTDTEKRIAYQLHSFIGVRSVRLFQEKSIVRSFIYG